VSTNQVVVPLSQILLKLRSIVFVSAVDYSEPGSVYNLNIDHQRGGVSKTFVLLLA